MIGFTIENFLKILTNLPAKANFHHFVSSCIVYCSYLAESVPKIFHYNLQIKKKKKKKKKILNF